MTCRKRVHTQQRGGNRAGWKGRAVMVAFSLLIEVARTTPEEVHQRLQRVGFAVSGDTDTVQRLVGDDTRRQMRVLSSVIVAAPG